MQLDCVFVGDYVYISARVRKSGKKLLYKMWTMKQNNASARGRKNQETYTDRGGGGVFIIPDECSVGVKVSRDAMS